MRRKKTWLSKNDCFDRKIVTKVDITCTKLMKIEPKRSGKNAMKKMENRMR